LAHARQQCYTLARRGPVIFLLPESDIIHLLWREAGSEQIVEDLGIATAERGGKVGTTERSAQLLTQPMPRREVHLRRIDQRPIHVPDDSRFVHHSSSASVSVHVKPSAANSSALCECSSCST